MKKTLTTVIAFTFLAAIGYAAPVWDTITDVVPDAPNTIVWNDFTDFVPDMDASPDGWLYLKLWEWDGSSVWDAFAGGNGQGYTYVYRAPANLTPGDYDTAWEQVLRFTANSEAGAKVSLAKRDGAFHGANFAARWDQGGNWDWSFMSYYVTNALGEPELRTTDNDGADIVYAPGNKHPYAVSQIAGFALYNGPDDYVAITSSGDNSGDNIANIEGRKIGGGTPWGPDPGQSTFARLTTDSKYKAWSRGIQFNNNVYIWKGPSDDTTDDGVWVVENVLDAPDTNAVATAIANAYNLIPVSTMGVNADDWNTSDAVGIAAFSASENYTPNDILVVSMNVDGGQILVFNLDDPDGGPIAFFGEENIMPAGADNQRLQLGSAGQYLFVLSGEDADDRELHRLDMVPEPSAILFGLGGLLLMLRKRG